MLVCWSFYQFYSTLNIQQREPNLDDYIKTLNVVLHLYVYEPFFFQIGQMLDTIELHSLIPVLIQPSWKATGLWERQLEGPFFYTL